MTIEEIIINAIKEDVGDGDHTTLATANKNLTVKMQLIVKEKGVIAGIDLAQKILNIHDTEITMKRFLSDGDTVKAGDIAFQIEGKVSSLLSIERTMLNFMQRMSGIATYTRFLVKKIEGFKTKLLDTRKTTPLLRLIEKEAVRTGGGYNHRFGLYDMIMIKDNHIDFAGGIKNTLLMTHNYLKTQNLNLEIVIEVRNLDDIMEVLEVGKVKRILLDNFNPQTMAKAVEIINGKFETEASGNINESNIVEYAKTGVDYISIGALTHHARSLDLSLKAVMG